mgnify:CR=1 FL=1
MGYRSNFPNYAHPPVERSTKTKRFVARHNLRFRSKIDNFIWQGNFHHFLPLPEVTDDNPLYIGVFLIGAYQEILGDLHNLFGDTNAAHIVLTDDGYEIQKIIDGETVADVLDYVQYQPKKLVKDMEQWVSAAMKQGKITPVIFIMI